MDNLYGFYPGKILSYSGDSKTVQVSIEPYTNGSEDGIQAKIAYPVGFTDADLELAIVDNPDVWVFFENGQFRNPVVGFFRTRRTGSSTGVLRLRQKSIELIADEIKFITAKTTTTGDAHTDGEVTSGGDMVAGGVSVKQHDHGGIQPGNGKTMPPTASGGGAKASRMAMSQFSAPVEDVEDAAPLTEYYTDEGLQSIGRMKLWRGQVQVKDGIWSCDYSSAGFMQKPMLMATNLVSTDQYAVIRIDTDNATTSQCNGSILSNAVVHEAVFELMAMSI